MTAQGSPTTVLRRAIKSGSLRSVDMALIDVPQVDLEDALEILALMARDGDPRRERWARRWLERASAAGSEQLERQLEELPSPRALEELRELAVRVRASSGSARVALRPSSQP